MATLKISDLSVGDWVRCGLWNGRIQRIAMHDGATVEVIIEADLGRLYMYKRVDEIYPIPITPEILEENGWLRNEEDEYMEYYGDPTSGIAHTKGTYHYRLEVPEVSAVCYFVHQLQHALRLAGGDEEINL